MLTTVFTYVTSVVNIDTDITKSILAHL